MRAAINRFNPDGGAHEIYASGLRNPVGLRWYPGTSELWATSAERDGPGSSNDAPHQAAIHTMNEIQLSR
ncbi:MAG: hypothetical protein ACREU9_14760 [Gammaproteobacteria bacterium]